MNKDWQQTLENPEITIHADCHGRINIRSTNRRRLSTGGWTIEAGKPEITFDILPMDLLDYLRFLEANHFVETRRESLYGVEYLIYRNAP